MSTAQRLTFLALAVVVAVVAFVVIGGDDAERSADAPPAATPSPAPGSSTASPEPNASATATPTATPRPRPPLLTAGSERTVSARQGEEVSFRVRHPAAEEVHVHGYDISRDLEAGRTATITFPADIAGRFEVELELSGQPLGTIEVRP